MKPVCAVEGCETRSWMHGVCFRHRPDKPAPKPTFPVAPLVELVEARGGLAECVTAHSAARRAYNRAQRRGEIYAELADRLSHQLLGCHPCEVWPEWYTESD